MARERLQSVWSITELAAASGLSRFQVRRLLKSKGVETERIGKKVIVPFTSLKALLPGLYATLASRIEEQTGHGLMCGVCNSTRLVPT